jgi:hypothetical protein
LEFPTSCPAQHLVWARQALTHLSLRYGSCGSSQLGFSGRTHTNLPGRQFGTGLTMRQLQRRFFPLKQVVRYVYSNPANSQFLAPYSLSLLASLYQSQPRFLCCNFLSLPVILARSQRNGLDRGLRQVHNWYPGRGNLRYRKRYYALSKAAGQTLEVARCYQAGLTMVSDWAAKIASLYQFHHSPGRDSCLLELGILMQQLINL